MPRFFFNIDAEWPDSVGTDLPDRKAARVEAIRAAGEMLKDLDGELAGEEWAMTVSDEQGRVVLEIRFSATERAVQ